MFNKFKSKKEESKYEEMYKGTSDELYEEDLDNLPSKFPKELGEKDNDELFEEDLDKIMGNIPHDQYFGKSVEMPTIDIFGNETNKRSR